MATRTPVIEIVEVQNYLSWRWSPEEIVWAFDKYGVDAAKDEMIEQLMNALNSAEAYYYERQAKEVK